jgi:hypothetical protein
MAMAPRLFRPCNKMLAEPSSEAYKAARKAVMEAETCLQAVELLGVLQHESADVQQEAAAVFNALPPHIDAGVLRALRNGFDREIAMQLWWEDNRGTEPSIEYSVADAGGLLRISFLAPNGRHFVS